MQLILYTREANVRRFVFQIQNYTRILYLLNQTKLVINYTDICNYADDNTPHAVDMSLEMLMVKLESAASKALNWFHSNAMKLNSSKCKLLDCGHKFECMICNVGNSDVMEAHEVKLLGVKIESDLTFKSHLGRICKTASQKLNALSRLFTYMHI